MYKHCLFLSYVLWSSYQIADDIFKFISMYENDCILTQFSLKFVLKGPVDNMSAFTWWVKDKRSFNQYCSSLMGFSWGTMFLLS